VYELLGICLTLAALLVINALASVGAAMLWRILTPRTLDWSWRLRSRIIFALRAFPAAAASLFVCALLIPSYLVYEPHLTNETVTLKLVVLASISMFGIALAVWRGAASWHATQRLVKEWSRGAKRIAFAEIEVPAYVIEHEFPIVAVVGIFRPRLFIARCALDSLNENELRAVIAHETGHLVTRDNLKRAVVRACRDVLMIVPVGRALDRAWSEAAEAAADEFATEQGGASVALDLAQSLIKIARLAPVGMKLSVPAGVFLIEEPDGVNNRVRRLALMASRNFEFRRAPKSYFTKLALSLSVMCIVAALFFTGGYSHALTATHHIIERVVSVLQ